MDDSTKWCFVPTCLNSTKNTVNKWFVPIPVKPKRRELWFKAVNRNYCPNSERSLLFCCSDHFNLNEDAGDFYEKNGEVVVKLKSTILPRIASSSSNALTPPQGPRISSDKLNSNSSQGNNISQNVISNYDIDSSDEEGVDVVNVITSNPSDLRKALMNQRLASAKPSKLLSGKSISKAPTAKKSKQTTRSTPPSSSTNNQPVEASGQALKYVFENLRKVIPSISNQQGLTKEQILDEAIEFMIQMRNKSDKRQSTMQYMMESNATLTAKIQHLEGLVSTHEKNELVLTKQIVDRRLGAVSASKPASLSSTSKANKQKSKR